MWRCGAQSGSLYLLSERNGMPVNEKTSYSHARQSRAWLIPFVVAGLACLCGCATPVGVSRLGERGAYHQITKSALNSRGYSSFTASVLHRYNLSDFFGDSPERCIGDLHRIALEDDRRDTLFALSELCYLRAQKAPANPGRKGKLTQSDYHLGSAVYAYLYLLGDVSGEPPSPYDRRFRMACDLYNRALATALIDKDGQLRNGREEFRLPVSRIHLQLPKVDMSQFGKIVSADRYHVRGLSVRDRAAGLGAPIIAVKRKTKTRPYPVGLAATMFLRVEGGLDDISSGAARGTVEVHSPFTDKNVQVNKQSVPLETDLSTQLAYTLDNPALWGFGKKLFLSADRPIKSGLYTIRPHMPGKIPVVFVHGTMSSPIWWAEMLNTLRADPKIRENYQCAFYLYDSGKRITFSAAHMRDALMKYVREADPENTDPAMQQMVLVGHSQGGLLIKLAVTDTGDTLQRIYIDEDLDAIDATKKERDLIRRYTHFESLPFVTRTVFIATPHHGSYRAKGLPRRLAHRFMRFPKYVLDTSRTVLGIAKKNNVPKEVLPGKKTSVDDMAPTSKLLLTLADMPPAAHVKAHSIIAIKGNDEPPQGEDGVVRYTSAHVDYVDSELIVRNNHSCQQHPATIEEVRRILLRHMNAGIEKAGTK
jgi:pimeloyl-ACP methyl ester carboxylesterase